MREIEITIESLAVEGVDIQYAKLIPQQIERALLQLINEKGYPTVMEMNNVENLSAGPLNYTTKLNGSTVADSVAKSVYPRLGNAIDSSSGVDH